MFKKSKKAEGSAISKLTKTGKLKTADLKKVVGGSVNYNSSKSNTGNNTAPNNGGGLGSGTGSNTN